MRVGQIFRYARPYDPDPRVIDGLPNYFFETGRAGSKLTLLDSGINPIAKVRAPEGERVPAILISSSPHKRGSSTTPWQDFFDSDNGHIRYFGDAKTPGMEPGRPPGNKALLSAFEAHHAETQTERRSSTPVVFFERTSYGGRAKGNVEFQGFGIIERVELVTQLDRSSNSTFSNYAYDFAVLSLTTEGEEFSWQWINDRRDPALSLEETLKNAPSSWKAFLRRGVADLGRARRRVSALMTSTKTEQSPTIGSTHERLLDQIYSYYDNKKHQFEALAARVAERVLSRNGATYLRGWITPPSADEGADFVGRIDIGSGFSRIKQVVYGQAKCEKPSSTTSGRDVARTVARLRRGWIGVYVTTGSFSEPVQREIIEDEYPILLIPGSRVAHEVDTMLHEGAFASLDQFLDDISSTYRTSMMRRRPTEILKE